MNVFLTILKMLPAIIAAVKALEEFAPLPETGKAKLDLILNFAKDLGGDAEKAIPIITNVVGKLVAFANALGIFAKKA